MPDGFALLFQDAAGFLPDSLTRPHLERVFRAILAGWPAYGEPAVADDMAAVGEYLLDHRGLPLLRGPIGDWHKETELMTASGAARKLSQVACLGAAGIVCILTEKGEPTWPYEGRGSEQHLDELGPIRGLLPYLERRAGTQRGGELPVLPVPDDFKQIFRDWAEGQVDFTA